MNQSWRGSKLVSLLLQPVLFSTVFATFCTLIGFLDRFYWAFEFATYDRVQYAIALLASALVLAVSRRWADAIVAAAGLAINLAVIAPLYFPPPSIAAGPIVHRAVLVNLLKENQNYQAVRDFIRSANPEFVIFVEVTDVWGDALKPLEDQFPYSEAQPRDGPSGIAIFSRIPWTEANVESLDGAPPSVVAHYELDGQPLTVIGLHPAPPYGPVAVDVRTRRLVETTQLISTQPGAVMVLADLNITSWASAFPTFLQNSGLRDSRLGFGVQATWPVASRFWRVPVDHILISPDVLVHNRHLGPDIGSDHYPVVIEFSIADRKTSPP